MMSGYSHYSDSKSHHYSSGPYGAPFNNPSDYYSPSPSPSVNRGNILDLLQNGGSGSCNPEQQRLLASFINTNNNSSTNRYRDGGDIYGREGDGGYCGSSGGGDSNDPYSRMCDHNYREVIYGHHASRSESSWDPNNDYDRNNSSSNNNTNNRYRSNIHDHHPPPGPSNCQIYDSPKRGFDDYPRRDNGYPPYYEYHHYRPPPLPNTSQTPVLSAAPPPTSSLYPTISSAQPSYSNSSRSMRNPVNSSSAVSYTPSSRKQTNIHNNSNSSNSISRNTSRFENSSTNSNNSSSNSIGSSRETTKFQTRKYYSKINQYIVTSPYWEFLEIKKRFSQLYLPDCISRVNMCWTTDKPKIRLDLKVPIRVISLPEDPLAPAPLSTLNSRPEIIPGKIQYWIKIMIVSGIPYQSYDSLIRPQNTQLPKCAFNKDETLVHLSQNIKFLVVKRQQRFCAVGGLYDPEIDGKDINDPDTFKNAAVRILKEQFELDMSACNNWSKFMTIDYAREDSELTDISVYMIPSSSDALSDLEKSTYNWKLKKLIKIQSQGQKVINELLERKSSAMEQLKAAQKKLALDSSLKEDPVIDQLNSTIEEIDQKLIEQKKENNSLSIDNMTKAPPGESHLLVTVRGAKIRDCQYTQISLDSLLIHNFENDREEDSIELSIFAEVFWNYLQYKFGHRIMKALIANLEKVRASKKREYTKNTSQLFENPKKKSKVELNANRNNTTVSAKNIIKKESNENEKDDSKLNNDCTTTPTTNITTTTNTNINSTTSTTTANSTDDNNNNNNANIANYNNNKSDDINISRDAIIDNNTTNEYKSDKNDLLNENEKENNSDNNNNNIIINDNKSKNNENNKNNNEDYKEIQNQEKNEDNDSQIFEENQSKDNEKNEIIFNASNIENQDNEEKHINERKIEKSNTNKNINENENNKNINNNTNFKNDNNSVNENQKNEEKNNINNTTTTTTTTTTNNNNNNNIKNIITNNNNIIITIPSTSTTPAFTVSFQNYHHQNINMPLLRAFHFFDRNRTGSLRAEDLENLLYSLGASLSRHYVTELILKADKDISTGRFEKRKKIGFDHMVYITPKRE